MKKKYGKFFEKTIDIPEKTCILITVMIIIFEKRVGQYAYGKATDNSEALRQARRNT